MSTIISWKQREEIEVSREISSGENYVITLAFCKVLAHLETNVRLLQTSWDITHCPGMKSDEDETVTSKMKVSFADGLYTL